MTLRQQFEDEGSGVHDQVDAILDSEDSMIILIDARRAINYVRGFALSPCQLELLANDIERLVRTVTRAPAAERRENDMTMKGGCTAASRVDRSAAELAIDEVLAESFPASDPPS